MTRRVAIIPARGGSKRIPRKNIREFAGKPMIVHSIACALRSRLFERIIVSTDDDEIGAVARENGAEVPFIRPAELSGDVVGTTGVVAHALRWLHGQHDQPEAVCCIYATAPFIHVNDLRAALSLYESGRWQYVFAATTFAAPIFRSFRSLGDDGLQMFFPEHFLARSQDLPEALHDAAQFYWGRPRAWLDGEKVFDSHSTVTRIPRWRVQDIDTEEDWRRAEAMAGFALDPELTDAC